MYQIREVQNDFPEAKTLVFTFFQKLYTDSVLKERSFEIQPLSSALPCPLVLLAAGLDSQETVKILPL